MFYVKLALHHYSGLDMPIAKDGYIIEAEFCGFPIALAKEVFHAIGA
ncbi:MAG: hypothetical protein JSW38_06040 [Dehalococcoidia bacterium]|nr:MAG: hypothetical protein JSW38_06040 [Dehalococcoidia bacterium]